MAGFKEQFGLHPVADDGLSDLDWYKQQLAGSGISADLADYNEITLHSGHYEMPYFDINGEYTRVSTRRNHTNDKDYRYGRKAGAGKGVQPLCYWPRHPGLDATHSELLARDIDWPLWITEGEKKALCLQDALVRGGLRGSVVSVPGVTNYAALQRETRHVYMKGGKLQRPVWIVFDWHHDNVMVHGSEANLYDGMVGRGAEVNCLRWKNTANKEQKIDDYLVDAGSLVDAVRYSHENPAVLPKEDYRWLNDNYAVLDGRVCKLKGGLTISKAEFLVDTAPLQELDKSGKHLVPSGLGWLNWKYRTVVTGRCVVLPDVGTEPQKVVNKRLNLARKWPADLRVSESSQLDLLDTHLRRFCDTEAHWIWLRQHIAHMIRHPNVMTSNAVALADDGGTGKGLLMSILAKTLGDLFVLVGSELTTKFNEGLAGKLLAYYDEPPSDKWEGGALDKATKKLVGNPRLTIEGKGTRPFEVENRCRLWVSTNLQTVYGIPATERRWNYFSSTYTLTPEEAKVLADFRDSDHCAGRVVGWALGMDLSGYDPMQRGPDSLARRDAVSVSRGSVQYFLEECDDLDNGADIWESARLYDLYRLFTGGRFIGINSFGSELNRLLGRDSVRVLKVDGKTIRARAVRDVAQWKDRTPADWVGNMRVSKII